MYLSLAVQTLWILYSKLQNLQKSNLSPRFCLHVGEAWLFHSWQQTLRTSVHLGLSFLQWRNVSKFFYFYRMEYRAERVVLLQGVPNWQRVSTNLGLPLSQGRDIRLHSQSQAPPPGVSSPLLPRVEGQSAALSVQQRLLGCQPHQSFRVFVVKQKDLKQGN